MKIAIIKIVLLLCCITSIKSNSVVYNLRIAQTTKHHAMEEDKNRPYVVAGTLFQQWRTVYTLVHQSFTGGLLTCIYATDSFYGKIDWAAAHCNDNFSLGKTQTDDILLSAGYSYTVNERIKTTFSGLLGIPTHKDTSLEGVEFGTGHVGIGAQCDGSFSFSGKKDHMIMTAARYVHFFKSKAEGTFSGRELLFDLNLGDVVDLFIAYQSRWGRRHSVEMGYNPTFFFNASVQPNSPEIIKRINGIRSSFYASYQYGFLLDTMLSALTLGLSYSFDHKPKDFGVNHSVTLWGTWGINF